MPADPAGDSLRFETYGGSVPPPHHADTFYTLGADGTGVARTERSYGRGEVTEAPLALAPEALSTLWSALHELGLFATDWTVDPGPHPRGGRRWKLLATHLGETATVPTRVIPEQAGARRAIGERVREAMKAARL